MNIFRATARIVATVLFTLAAAAALHAQTVNIRVTDAGLSSIQYQDREYLGYGDFRLNAVLMTTPNGQKINGSVQARATVDVANRRLIRSYDWGTVTVAYSTAGSRLQMSIATTNASPNTITGLFFDTLGLRFASKPQEFDRSIPILGTNTGAPTALRMTFDSGVVVATNDDVTRPLVVGFPWALDGPASTLFPLKINTAKEVMYPDNIPFIDRRIAPGGSDTYRLSLRFGDRSASTATLAADVYNAFAMANPMKVTWPDRRPIGSLILATAATGWPTNPRGWFLDPSIDVTTPAGIAAFKKRVLAWADASVAVLKSMNAQGMITWDIEGERYPHATTYIGDPRVFATLAPEMADVADEYFKKFRDAGLRVGVCIRPQQLVVSANGSTARQDEVGDPTQLLIDKIKYAKDRWGATLFYVDSNGDPNLPSDLDVFKRVMAANPGILIIPEHETTGYYSVTAPYHELRQGYASTPSAVRDVYPGAFSILNTADGPIDARYNDLKAAVKAGDILLFRGWWNDPGNAKVKSLYPTVADPEPPTVSLIYPALNSLVAGKVTVSASATSTIGIAGVRLWIDGVPPAAEITSGPFLWQWDTTLIPNGAHILTVVARDYNGVTRSATATINVRNVVTPPTVAFLTPSTSAIVSGVVPISTAASSVKGIAGVRYLLDNVNIGVETTTRPYSLSWNTLSVANGTHTLSAIARDLNGATAQSSISVQVRNTVLPPPPPPPPPSPVGISLVSPSANSTVSGSVVIAAQASGSAVAGVRFLLDNAPIGSELLSPPFTLTWNSAAFANGAHTLSAIGRDSAGNSTIAAGMRITIANLAVLDSIKPVTVITSPQANSTVGGIITLAASASDNVGVAGISFLVDGVLTGEATSVPYTLAFDSRATSGGPHYVTAFSRDAAGNTSANTASFSVSNSVAPVCGTTGIRVFVGCYYAGGDLIHPKLTRLDPEVVFDWAGRAPDPSLPPNNYSVTWQGKFPFEGGRYNFELKAEGGARLYIDGKQVVEGWLSESYQNYSVSSILTEGTHLIRVEYRRAPNTGMVKLFWQRN